MQKKILDVGCGQNKFPGAIGIDANRLSHADVIHDLGTFPYPFADDEFEEIICRHVIEHVPDVLGFVNELHRITKPGGVLKIVTPHYSNPDWATDPTHRNHFNSYSFTHALSVLHDRGAETLDHTRQPGKSLAGVWNGVSRQP